MNRAIASRLIGEMVRGLDLLDWRIPEAGLVGQPLCGRSAWESIDIPSATQIRY